MAGESAERGVYAASTRPGKRKLKRAEARAPKSMRVTSLLAGHSFAIRHSSFVI
jgi:hypothetical protein